MVTDRRNEVKRVLMVALVINLSMTGLKLVLGLVSGSLAVVADAMHSATDALSSLMGLLTNGLSDPHPDRDHPYGHEKYEAVGALAIAGFILFTALEILITAGERLLQGLTPLRINGPELLLLLVVLLCNVGLAIYERRQGRRLQSQLLLADARHTMSDIWTTVIVLVGLSGAWLLGISWLCPWCSCCSGSAGRCCAPTCHGWSITSPSHRRRFTNRRWPCQGCSTAMTSPAEVFSANASLLICTWLWMLMICPPPTASPN